MTRELLRDLLEDQGHQVLEAADGVEALCIYHQNPIDLVITDIQMPRKNGLELIEEISNDVKIIAMAAYGEVALPKAARLGASCTFQKPFNVREMIESVMNLIGEGISER